MIGIQGVLACATLLTLLAARNTPPAVRQLMSNIGCGTLRIDTERVPLGEVENAWHQEQHGRRAVIIP
jgi:hypothetical protein